MPRENIVLTFTARLRQPAQPGDAPGWGFVLLPAPATEPLPRRGRLTAMLHVGEYGFPVLLEPDGKLGHWFALQAGSIEQAQLKFGDTFSATLALPAQEPAPGVPADFAAMLASHDAALATWQSTTAVAQLDWIHWVESARQASTRAKRIADAATMLGEGSKRVCCFDTSGHYSKALRAPAEAIDQTTQASRGTTGH